jgi:hypothetical protein
MRLHDQEYKALPQFNSGVDDTTQGWRSIITCFILMGGVLKCLNLFKWHNQVSKLSKLITAVMATVVTLLTFFLGWILVFALLFQVLGFAYSNNDDAVKKAAFNNLNYWDYIITSWKVGTKGAWPKFDVFWYKDSHFSFMY